jgi:hypothetical protein
MLRRVLLAAAITALGLGQAQSAAAQLQPGVPTVDPIDIPPDHDPLANAWDQPDDRGGLYVRGGIGLGFQSTRIGLPPWESASNGTRALGFASGFSVDVGYLLNQHVALHLDTHVNALWSGNIERQFGVAGEDYGDARIAAFGLAPAVTLFSRRDFFFKVGVGVGLARSRWPGHHETSKPGVFADLTVGKDLYRDDHNAFGLHMQFVYMYLGDDRRDNQLRVRALTWGVSYAFDSI